MSTDYYPRNAEARLVWHNNLMAKLNDGFATKYNIHAAAVTQAGIDRDWMEYWVARRQAAEVFKQQLTKYFNEVSGNDPSLDAPIVPVPPDILTPPTTVPPGIEFRAREIARQVKGHMLYSVTDGEALGIVPPESGPQLEVELVPEFSVRTLADFALEITFRRKSTDALKFQYRNKGGEWKSAGFLLTSPGTISIAPQELGVAQQIELRAIFLIKNVEVGSYSDAKPAFIAP